MIHEIVLRSSARAAVTRSVRHALEQSLRRLGTSARVSEIAPTLCATISLPRWQAIDLRLLELDTQLHECEDRAPTFGLVLETSGGRDVAAVAQVLERYQRLLPLARPLDDHVRRALARFRALLDLRKPLVRADHDHALDTWRWVLRLEPHASPALQLAALLHDLERVESEADVRVEHLALDYQRFKNAHARRGALRAALLLMSEGLPRVLVARTCELIEHHEAPSFDAELARLNDADALSFFSLNSWGFFEYFGLEHTRRKIEYTLRRLGPSARHYLSAFRYHPRVAAILSECGPWAIGVVKSTATPTA